MSRQTNVRCKLLAVAAIPASELGPELRARLGLKPTGRQRPKPSTAGSSGWNLRCCDCGAAPHGEQAATNHTATTGHHLWAYPLEDAP